MSAGSGCTGVPTTFTITVNPASSPAIVAGTVTGTISACAGSASASPNIQQFTVSGSNLANNITATAPNGFEVSLSPGSGYNTSIFITPSGSSVSNTIVDVRSSASANAGNISGNVVLTSPGAPSQNVAVTRVVNALPTVNAVASQSLNNGTTTAAINFTGTASTFTWINDTPGIGLPASGSGNIAPFTAVNNDIAPVTATIRVTPSSTGASCSGAPATFTITVAPDPYATTPAIIAGAATGTITACAGSPSASPNIQQFTVSGSNLTGNIIATAPAGFEVSLNSATGYSNNVTLVQNGGTVNNTIVYVRSAASAPAGNISGNVVLSSTGAISQDVAVNGSVNALPTVNAVANQTVNNGTATTAVNFTGTGDAFSWVNDTPGIGLAASGNGNIASFTAINASTSAVTAKITVIPESGKYAYVPNASSNNVSVINVATNIVKAVIPVGGSPYGVAVTPDGKAVYITDQRSSEVSVINTATNSVTATIPVGPSPIGIAINPDGSRAYVANADGSFVSVINTATNDVIASINMGGSEINGISVSQDGKWLYVTITNENAIAIISTATNTSLNTISVGGLSAVFYVATSPVGNRVYVTGGDANNLLVINSLTNALIATIPLGYAAVGCAVSPDGSRVYVTNEYNNMVSVVNTANNTVLTTIPVGTSPEGIAVAPDGASVLVSNVGSNSISIINTATNTVTNTVTVGQNPHSVGNFIATGTMCPGTPTIFTITVNPTAPASAIVATLASGTITACAGSPSASPNIQQFTVSGSNLTGDIKMTAPSGFEVSLTQGSGYGSSITLTQSGGTVANTVVYVRSSSLAFAGAISGNVVLTSTGATNQNVAVSGVINAIPVVNQPISLSYINGQSAGVNFAGTADTYSWVNNQPGIGLAASGTGNIGLFNAVNTGNSPVVATITVTPSNSTGCHGPAKTFTITVNPTPSGISVGGHLSALNTVYGTPSSRESFTVSGINLNAKVTITAPAGFELSADGDTFFGSVNISAPGTLASTDIYIRLAATTPVGNYSGNIVIASAGATSVNVAMPNSTVRPAPLVITADDKARFYETPNPDFTVQYSGFVNNENTPVLTKQPVASTAATLNSLPGQYPITVSGASSPNYSISFVSGILTINAALQAVVIPNVFTPNGDGINDTWDVANLDAYVNCTVDVFSRYGQKVFSSVGYSAPWNGTRNNAAIPVGTYYYIINLNNGQKAYAGYVTIIR